MDVIVPIQATGFAIVEIPDHWDIEDKEESIRDLAIVLIDRAIIKPKISEYVTIESSPVAEMPF